jgi:hypothetical protein
MRNGPCCDVRFYVYWIYIGGHAWRLAQGRVPPPLRPLIDTLDSITDAHTYY